MRTPSLRGFAVAGVAAIALASPAPATGVTNIDACQTLDKFGETYRVTQDISSCSLFPACLTVANDRITIDLQGHQIASGCIFAITDGGIARDSITVKNGVVSAHFTGI